MKFVRYVFHGSSSPCPGGGKRRFAFGIWAALVAVAVVVGSVSVAAAGEKVYFVGPTGITGITGITENSSGIYTFEDGETSGTNFTTIKNDTSSTELGTDNTTKWYVVTDAPNSSLATLTVKGDVRLILITDKTLTVTGAITLTKGSAENQYASLTIYKGSTTEIQDASAATSLVGGTLTAASIVDGDSNTGTITVNGGTVTLSATTDSLKVSELDIDGGVVQVTGGGTASEIANGTVGLVVDGGEVTAAISTAEGSVAVNGGTVTATGTTGQGITAKSMTVAGGEVTATGGDDAPGIELSYTEGTALTVSGGKLTVTGGNAVAEESGTAAADGIVASEAEISITGGEVVATGGNGSTNKKNGGSGISAGKVTISGGKVTANAGTTQSDGNASEVYGINAAEIVLGYTNAEDSITASSYLGTSVKVADNEKFVYLDSETSTDVKPENDRTIKASDATEGCTSLDTLKGKTLYPAVYKVVFSLNYGDEPETETQYVLYNGTATEPTLTTTRTGYTKQAGWFTKTVNEEQETYESYTLTNVIENDLELFAQWTGNTYKVTFDVNGGDTTTFEFANSWSNGGNYTFGTDLPFPTNENALTRSGYTFKGWATASDATTATYDSTDDDKKTLLADAVTDKSTDGYGAVTLYAIWEATAADTLTITLTLNGGTIKTGEPATDTTGWTTADGDATATRDVAKTSETEITLPTPTREGYAFGGWNNGTTTAATITITPKNDLTADTTYSAIWRKSGGSSVDTYKSATAPTVAYRSMVLGGQISVMFYAYLPQTGNNIFDPATCKMYFSVGKNGDTSQNPDGVSYSKTITEVDGSTTYTLYGYECFLTSAQMADEITLILKQTDKDDYTFDTKYTAQDYLDKLKADTGSESSAELGKAIIDYGYYVQKMLAEEHSWGETAANWPNTAMTAAANDYSTGTKTPDAANTALKAIQEDDNFVYNITLQKDGTNVTLSDGTSGTATSITAMSFSLLLENETTIRLYMKLGDEATISSVQVDDGTEYTADTLAGILTSVTGKVGKSDMAGYTYLDIPGIAAHELGKPHTVTIKVTPKDGEAETYTVKLSALSYVYTVLNPGTATYTDATKNAVAALYYYYDATKTYQAAQQNYPDYVGENN